MPVHKLSPLMSCAIIWVLRLFAWILVSCTLTLNLQFGLSHLSLFVIYPLIALLLAYLKPSREQSAEEEPSAAGRIRISASRVPHRDSNHRTAPIRIVHFPFFIQTSPSTRFTMEQHSNTSQIFRSRPRNSFWQEVSSKQRLRSTWLLVSACHLKHFKGVSRMSSRSIGNILALRRKYYQFSGSRSPRDSRTRHLCYSRQIRFATGSKRQIMTLVN